MKSIKNALTALAFVFAIGAAFATLPPDTDAYRETVTIPCGQFTLSGSKEVADVTGQCFTDVTGTRCTVIISGSSTENAYLTACNNAALYVQ